MTLLAFALAAGHLAFSALALLRLKRGLDSPGRPYMPPVSVLVACKSALPDDGRWLRALVDQRYEGPREYLFIVASADAPAAQEVKRALADSPARWRLLVSGAKPERASEQNLNLLYGLKNISAGAEALVFADADVSVRPDWLASLTAPLAAPLCGLSTSAALPVPPAVSLVDILKCAWILYGLPYLVSLPYAAGASMAMRRAEFEKWRVAERWERAANMDLVTAEVVREMGRTVRYAAAAAPWDSQPASWPMLRDGFVRWLLHFRFYGPLVWFLGAAVTVLKLGVWAWSLARLRPLPVLTLVFGDAAALALFAAGVAALYPDRYASAPKLLSLKVAAAVPALHALFAANFLTALVSPVMRWSGFTYRLSGPFLVRATKV